MQDAVCRAIQNRQVIKFLYDGAWRTVEPHQLGLDHDGDLTLSAWQLSGGSGVDWRDFHIANVSGLTTAGQNFSGPRPGYNPHNSKMSRVLCSV